MGVEMLRDEIAAGTPIKNPFSAIIETVMDLGGFPKFAGALAITASLAAIMSTADSLIIAISQLVTVEVIQEVFPNVTNVTWLGRCVSLASTAFALLIGLLWTEGISELGGVQFAITSQCVPVFLVGLFSKGRHSDVHPWTVAAASLLGALTCVLFYFLYLLDNPDAKPVTPAYAGLIVNLSIMVVFETIRRVMNGDNEALRESCYEEQTDEHLIFANRPAWDVPNLSKYGDKPCNPGHIWNVMEGVYEPFTNPFWIFTFFYGILMCTPMVEEKVPPFTKNDDGTNNFLFAPVTVNGIPWWFLKSIVLAAAMTCVLLFSFNRMPSKFEGVREYMKEGDHHYEAEDDDKAEKEKLDEGYDA